MSTATAEVIDLFETDEQPLYSCGVPTYRLDTLRERLDKLIKRCADKGLTGFAYSVGEVYIEKVFAGYHDDEGHPVFHEIEHADVTLYGERPTLGDWTVLAQIEHTEAGNIVRTINSEAGELERFRECDPLNCDHCGYRRHRKNSYVIRSADGDEKQVGSTCLTDFTGHDVASIVAFYGTIDILQSASALDPNDPFYWSAGAPKGVPRKMFLAICAQIIEEDGGYVSRSKAYDQAPTADLAWDRWVMIRDGKKLPNGERPRLPEDRHRDKAEAALQWASEVEPTNDYLHNLSVISKLECWEHKHLGYAASIFGAKQRAEEREVQRKQREKQAKQSDYFGEQGERLELDVTVETTKLVSGYYGDKILYRFRTDAGNVMIWWCTGEGLWVEADDRRAEAGDRFTVRATIKGHDAYRSERQTTVNRVHPVEYLGKA